MFADDLSSSSIGRRSHLAASRRAAGYRVTRPRLPAARFGLRPAVDVAFLQLLDIAIEFPQLLDVRQRHCSPPRSTDSLGAKAAATSSSAVTMELRRRGVPAPEPENSQVRWQSGQIRTACVGSYGRQRPKGGR